MLKKSANTPLTSLTGELPSERLNSSKLDKNSEKSSKNF
jgi:hypothetical protein